MSSPVPVNNCKL